MKSLGSAIQGPHLNLNPERILIRNWLVACDLDHPGYGLVWMGRKAVERILRDGGAMGGLDWGQGD